MCAHCLKASGWFPNCGSRSRPSSNPQDICNEPHSHLNRLYCIVILQISGFQTRGVKVSERAAPSRLRFTNGNNHNHTTIFNVRIVSFHPSYENIFWLVLVLVNAYNCWLTLLWSVCQASVESAQKSTKWRRNKISHYYVTSYVMYNMAFEFKKQGL